MCLLEHIAVDFMPHNLVNSVLDDGGFPFFGLLFLRLLFEEHRRKDRFYVLRNLCLRLFLDLSALEIVKNIVWFQYSSLRNKQGSLTNTIKLQLTRLILQRLSPIFIQFSLLFIKNIEILIRIKPVKNMALPSVYKVLASLRLRIQRRLLTALWRVRIVAGDGVAEIDSEVLAPLVKRVGLRGA